MSFIENLFENSCCWKQLNFILKKIQANSDKISTATNSNCYQISWSEIEYEYVIKNKICASVILNLENRFIASIVQIYNLKS